METPVEPIKYRYNRAFGPYMTAKVRYCFIWGGAGSGKSYSVMQKHVYRLMMEPGHKFLLTRKVARTIRGSLFELAKEVIEAFGRTHLFDIKEGSMDITYIPNGNRIVFAGLDDRQKLKSLTGVTGIWAEEVTEFDQKDYMQLDLRLRGETPHYKQYTATFNPVDVTHWIKDQMDKSNPAKTFTLRTTYKDNKFIDEEYLDVLEQNAALDPNYARVYRDGEWGLPKVDHPFFYSFGDHNVSSAIELDERLPVYLSFDFNINPMTATVHQFQYMKWYHTLHEFRGSNMGVEEFCNMILASKLGHLQFIVTGDATGRNRTATAGNRTNYDIIQQKLKLTGRQLRVPKKNPPMKQSRTLSNHILGLHPNRLIHPRCEHLLSDLSNVEYNDATNKPKPPSPDMGHLLDTMRYMDNQFLHYFVRDSRNLKRPKR